MLRTIDMLQSGGWIARGFEPVGEAFAANFEDHGDPGAACCVYRDGSPVADLWAGFAGLEEDRFWAENTIQLIVSAAKGITAVCVHLLVERGVLDLDAPIAAYWSEFAVSGKGAIPVRWALCHKAGLAAVDGDLNLEDVLTWQPMVAAIAAQVPNWAAGSAYGYHARSSGWILGKVVRRIIGRSLGRFVADLLGANSLTARVMSGPSNLFAFDEMWNRPELRAAEMPSSNGIASARALARMYAAFVGKVDGGRLLRVETVAAACEGQSDGLDRVLFVPSRFGLGFMLAPGCGQHCSGHPGTGGCLGFADPETHLGFGYVTTRMKLEVAGDERQKGLIDAVYGCMR